MMGIEMLLKVARLKVLFHATLPLFLGAVLFFLSRGTVQSSDQVESLGIEKIISGYMSPLKEKMISCEGAWILNEYDPASRKCSKLVQQANFHFNLDGSRAGYFRLDLDPIVSQWTNGKADYIEDAKTFCYNGRFWIYALRKTGKKGESFDIKQAWISEKQPQSLGKSLYESGQIFWLPSIRIFERESILTAVLKPNEYNPSIKKIKDGENDLLEISFQDCVSNPYTTDTLWVDPNKGYSLVKRETKFRLNLPVEQQLRALYICSNLKEIAPNFYIPLKATFERYQGNTPRDRFEIKWESCSVADAQSSEKYDFAFSRGWFVTDQRIGSAFKIGDSPEEVLKDIQNQKK